MLLGRRALKGASAAKQILATAIKFALARTDARSISVAALFCTG